MKDSKNNPGTNGSSATQITGEVRKEEEMLEETKTKVEKKETAATTVTSETDSAVQDFGEVSGEEEALASETNGIFDEMEGEKALEEIRPRLFEIPAHKVRRLNVSRTQAIKTGLTYAQAYAKDRALFAKLLTKDAFDPDAHDDLEVRAKGFWQVDILLRQGVNPDGPLHVLLAEAKPLRAKLNKAAVYLWGDDPVLGEVLAGVHSGKGYDDKADDLGSLSTLFSENWKMAEGQCSVTFDDVIKAQALGAAIFKTMSSSEKEVLNELRDLRDRSGEYLRQGIENIKAGAIYIFRKTHEEIGRYPSLFLRRKKKRNGARVNGNAQADSGAPPPPVVEDTTISEPPSPMPSMQNDVAETSFIQ